MPKSVKYSYKQGSQGKAVQPILDLAIVLVVVMQATV